MLKRALLVATLLATGGASGACSSGDGDQPGLTVEPINYPTLLTQPEARFHDTAVVTGELVVDDLRNCFGLRLADPPDDDDADGVYPLVAPRGSRVTMMGDVIRLDGVGKIAVGESLTLGGEILDFANRDETPDTWRMCGDGEYRYIAVHAQG